jgi:hypothetical protein
MSVSTPTSASQAAGDVRAQSKPKRTDVLVLWLGIGASFAFTALIWVLGPRLATIQHLPDTGASWYYWQLPQQTVVGQVTAWGFYAAHQMIIWGLIFAAQRQRAKYTTSLHWFNVAALAANAFFILLHVVQTHVWYDGLAQDVSIWSSQGSVILLLVMILLMENPRRGLFFGKRAPLSKRAVQFSRKYHGYIFAWAVIYTFWYHPTEATSGHLVGFFYTFLLMLQGSLFFTRIHLNKYWTFTNEALVLAHGTLVAVMNANNLWPMFGFGFAGILVVTQLYGLGLPRWVRLSVTGLYVALALWVYSGRGWAQLNEVLRIPIVEYLAVFLLAGLLGLVLWLVQRAGAWIRPSRPEPAS